MLINENGYSISLASEELGVSSSTIYPWSKKYKKSSSKASQVASEELRELRKRIKQQEKEIQILKKAAAYFAKENM